MKYNNTRAAYGRPSFIEIEENVRLHVARKDKICSFKFSKQLYKGTRRYYFALFENSGYTLFIDSISNINGGSIHDYGLLKSIAGVPAVETALLQTAASMRRSLNVK